MEVWLSSTFAACTTLDGSSVDVGAVAVGVVLEPGGDVHFGLTQASLGVGFAAPLTCGLEPKRRQRYTFDWRQRRTMFSY